MSCWFLAPAAGPWRRRPVSGGGFQEACGAGRVRCGEIRILSRPLEKCGCPADVPCMINRHQLPIPLQACQPAQDNAGLEARIAACLKGLWRLRFHPLRDGQRQAVAGLIFEGGPALVMSVAGSLESGGDLYDDIE